MATIEPNEEYAQVLELLIAAANLAVDNCLIGPSVPKLEARDKRFRNPEPGDWVIEMRQARFLPFAQKRNAIGRLIMAREEPYHDWEEDELNGAAPMEKYYYIETLDGTLFKWYDCQFYVLFDFKDLIEDSNKRDIWRPDREHPSDLAESRAKWARDAAFRHGLIVWEPYGQKERQG